MKYESKKEEGCFRNTFFGEKIRSILSEIAKDFSLMMGLGMVEFAKVCFFFFFLSQIHHS